MQSGAFNQTSLAGEEFKAWLAQEEERHRTLMKEAGFLAGTN
jgi:tripartite-type tricarboxylate transporter receptor subunit TctC